MICYSYCQGSFKHFTEIYFCRHGSILGAARAWEDCWSRWWLCPCSVSLLNDINPPDQCQPHSLLTSLIVNTHHHLMWELEAVAPVYISTQNQNFLNSKLLHCSSEHLILMNQSNTTALLSDEERQQYEKEVLFKWWVEGLLLTVVSIIGVILNSVGWVTRVSCE